ncbi:MAG: sulfotransferase domain-containing protein [Pseudomonadota bacterium]
MQENPKGIIWLASYPKSGNTWTRNFLHNLLNVISGEDGKAHSINAMGLRSTWEIAAKPYEAIIGRPVDRCSREEIAAVRHTVQENIMENAGGLAFVKTHHALVMDRKQPTINFDVTAGAIYIIRNPLDVAISFSHHMNGTIDEAIEQMALKDAETPISEKAVYEVYGSWSQHVESWTRKPHRTILVMRYEDMLDDPLKAFGALASHLRLQATREQVEKAIELSSFEALSKQEDQLGFNEKPKEAKKFFRSGKSGQWRDELSKDQVRRIVSAHQAQMGRFGYVPEEF